jgi:hypothetical protein
MRAIVILFYCFVFSCSPNRMIETSLYFGQSKPGGGMVTEPEWKSFKENYIAKVFKEGSTIYNVSGNWLDPATNKLITEPTYIVTYYYKKSFSLSKQIDSLKYWYIKLFQQQSVLRVDKKARAYF